MSAWTDTKTALAARLTTVSITLPIEQSLKRVYVNPPASIEQSDLPCIVLGESPLDDEWASSLAREHYRLTASLLLRDEDAARGNELVEAYREDIKRVLRGNQTLLDPVTPTDPHAGIFEGPTFTEPQDIAYQNQRYGGIQFVVPIVVTDSAPGFGDTTLED